MDDKAQTGREVWTGDLYALTFFLVGDPPGPRSATRGIR